MNQPGDWNERFQLDIQFGYVDTEIDGPRHHNPRLVLNQDGGTVEHALLEELGRCERFSFSVAFISPGAIAQLKQHLHSFKGTGRIVTADFLSFNQPQAFAELLNLQAHTGIEVRRHTAKGFHPKGYVFERHRSITAIIGSSNLTSSALSQNHEWNLKVSAADGSDLANQLRALVDAQEEASEPLTQDWIDDYAARYVAPPHRGSRALLVTADHATIEPNSMQQDALLALDLARAGGAERAIVISATGTGKTILSALDVRTVDPKRLLFVVHREQILDRTIQEYRRVLGGAADDYGKLTGGFKQQSRRYVFATIQSLSQAGVLAQLDPKAFDYILVDEAHRAGAGSYQSVIQHFEPAFLLGMTATPERTDGYNLFELFHYNVPYEIRLNHALEAGMLSPFHYYGVADVTYEDGTTTTDETDLRLLISPDRVAHLLSALELYGQAGVPARGLIFCSRKDEAHALSAELNEQTLRGKAIRTVALTGDDAVATREQRVAELESGQLDYILTVDIFNEGVDIPSVNQIVMLRQTQSAIVFVQQLGRGLRLAEEKDYLVVIDFIGNYANNFMIPIALFGDESRNRESLRERLNETIEAGALPGLSSVSFDEVSRERILRSITANRLDSMASLKVALVAMQNRVGRVPELWDFQRFESVDPVLLGTKSKHYPALVRSLLRVDSGLSEFGDRALHLLSHEVLPAKRLHEFILLKLLLLENRVSRSDIQAAFESAGLLAGTVPISQAIDTFTLRGYPRADLERYKAPVAVEDHGVVSLTDAFRHELDGSSALAGAIDDLLKTGEALTRERYSPELLFTPGLQYSRRDSARLLGWPRSMTSTIYGIRTDVSLGVAALFVTLHKADDVDASTAYQDALLDPSSMRWFSKNNRTFASADVAPLLDGRAKPYVFVQKSDADGSDHYFLGSATVHDPVQTTMPGSSGEPLPVVTMTLTFDQPIKQGLFDYFRPDQLD